MSTDEEVRLHQAMLRTGQIITAEAFARESSDWIADHRRTLRCPSCLQPAYFRGRSRNGRAPCFGSLHHTDDCDASAAVIEEQGRAGAEATAVANDGSELEIVFDGPFTDADAGTRLKADPSAPLGGAQSRHHTGGEQESRVRHQQLRRVLVNLIQNPAYMQDPGRRIHVPERGRALATDLIREFSAVTEADLDRRMLVWGDVETIREPGTSANTIYVNAGNSGSNPFTIILTGDAAVEVRHTDTWTEAAEHAQFNTAPVHAIAYGAVRPGPGTCPFAMTVERLRMFAFRVGTPSG